MRPHLTLPPSQGTAEAIILMEKNEHIANLFHAVCTYCVST